MTPVTLRILCEGQTEHNFVIQVLGPHLGSRHVFARAEPLCRGAYGSVSYDRLRRAINADLGRSRRTDYVTTVIDLYGLGSFPCAECLPSETPLQRVARIEQAMSEDIPNTRFIPYLQLHEFEALVLADVRYLSKQFPDGDAEGAAERLIRDMGDQEPEMVDDGVNSAPSKRIARVIPAYADQKAIVGPAVAAAIGLETLRIRCAHFGEWLGRLEGLADEAADHR